MKIIERLSKQIDIIEGLVDELRYEKNYRGVERLVQLIIQALLDLGLMAISILNGRTPKKYSEIGEVLKELNLIDDKDAILLRSVAGLRNILVHIYARIDRDKVLSAAERIIYDAPRIASTIFNKVREREIDPKNIEKKYVVEKLSKILRNRVKAAFLFGSRVWGYIFKGDYDIAVFMPKNYTLFDLGLLQVDIAKTLEVDEENINLICLNSAPPELILEALNGIPIIVENQAEIIEIKTKAMTQILDIKESLKYLEKKIDKNF